MTPALETPRLLLRPLALADAEPIQRVFPQWEIVRYLNAIVPWPFPEGAALAHIRDHALPAMERADEWHWTLRRKTEPDALIGRIHLSRGESNNRGFWIVPECRGQALMTEAVIAVTDYWFDVLGFPVLRAPKAVANIASRRISEKTGMRLIGFIEHHYVSGRLPGEVWEVTAEEWRKFRKNRVVAWTLEFRSSGVRVLLPIP
ncbi:MAG TPA: GNAT family N-acetyltransferase [Acidobacteriaceae bacterium]|jgi:RimJ/RimL family protein N-acetyltransferase|nr:GNAT family N-acetyltransferase [Acidobacteriaceae bacterium]